VQWLRPFAALACLRRLPLARFGLGFVRNEAFFLKNNILLRICLGASEPANLFLPNLEQGHFSFFCCVF